MKRLFRITASTITVVGRVADFCETEALETGFEKFFAANPGVMSKPYKFGWHTDNLLSKFLWSEFDGCRWPSSDTL